MGAKPFFTLNVSVASIWRFRWCIITEIFSSKRSLKVSLLSLYTSLKAVSCISLIRLIAYYGTSKLRVIHIWRPPWGGGGELRQKWDVIGCRRWGVSECSGRPIGYIGFAPWPDIMLSQTLIYYWQKSSFWLWRQRVKPSFNDTIALIGG